MKLREGKIGIQESVSILSLVLTGLSVFTLHSKSAYQNGNTTYIWLPGGVILALLAVLLLVLVMKKGKHEDLVELYYAGLGRVPGRAALLALSAVLLWQALKLQTAFINAMQSYIFPVSQYEAIAMWIVPVAGYIAWGGLERIARSAKCVAAFSGITLLLILLIPAKAFSLFRLFPFPGDTPVFMATKVLCSSVEALPVMLLSLVFTGSMQGIANVKKSVCIAAISSAVLICAVQFVLALVFTSTQLKDMYMPLFRIDMTLLPGNYFLRQDKIELFLWVFAAIPAMAYLQYGAAVLYCKTTGLEDIRPALLSVFAWLLFFQLWLNSGFYTSFKNTQVWMDGYGFLLVYAPMLLGAVIAALRQRKGAAA